MLAADCLCHAEIKRSHQILLTLLSSTLSGKLMPRLNWKSLLLLTAVAVAGSAILISGIVSTIRLPLLGWGGIPPLVALVGLTVVCSRFIVPVTSVDGTNQTNKSVAEAFIFLAV